MTVNLTTTRRPALIEAFTAPKGFGDATLRDKRPDAIELLGGIPDPGVLPTAEIAEATARVLATPGVPALQYSRTEGISPLREWIAEREGVSVDRILITNGGFHGLSLAIQAVVERGDLVAVDNPIFPLFLRGLQLSDAKTLPVSVGPRGLDVDQLSDLLRGGARPSALYTVPDFHNPSQGTLPGESRAELVRLAEHYGFVILADNPYRELRFAGEQESVAEFNNSDHVLHINTFTKTLGPGLRLGWTVTPEHLARDLVALRSRQDSHSSTLVQAIIGELVTSDPGIFDATLNKARALYRNRAETLVTALHREAPGAFEIVLPEGGLFLWPKLADAAIDADQLAADASTEGVEYQRGSFFPSGPGTDADRHLRLAYGDVDEPKLEQAAVRLGRALSRQWR
ncbi:PLP-dependent aminotransferase family protein [Arthrobacter sp. DNA4]|uniref:aminotransferase-like domain-containing protein n=1 Tax=Micrococcaceae TaxID=1268 RepID=UPI0020CD9B1B|nr:MULTISPECIES: PLP-dependent aminotransferase family protein [Micrococcaceae]UTT71272.1 PLP-dependent aminotransferase family protein [Arthrobacter sp. DNA4]WRT15754.1 PLP-dependent aminotransferase family protein [Pseudarthrobacter sp. LT1]